jgi:signal peptidase I
VAKKAKRVPFDTTAKDKQENKRPRRGLQEDVPSTGFFRSASTRETFESIVVAIMLALIFKTFEVEAFVIPTGSMAPTLQGRHHDIECPKCKYRYRTGISPFNSSESVETEVNATYCPICRYGLKLEDRRKNADHGYFSGDRILVNKMAYDLSPPERWDVIVFKNPNKANQNYIKRLVGLPNEALLIENGDIFTWDQAEGSYQQRNIARKSPDKLRVMLELVDDNQFIPEEFQSVNWPLRWQQWSNSSTGTKWEVDESGAIPVYRTDGSGDESAWLRYRHIVPKTSQWDAIEKGNIANIEIPTNGAFIWDQYCYNERVSDRSQDANAIAYFFTPGLHNQLNPKIRQGLYSDEQLGTKPIPFVHWVGDLAMEADIDVDSDSGLLKFDLVEGGVHFQCSINVESGKVSLSASSDEVQFVDAQGQTIDDPVSKCSISARGNYDVRYANVDDAIYLWIDNQPVEFGDRPFQAYRRGDGKLLPKYSANDPADAEPLGIASQGVALTVNHLRVLRDIYYISVRGVNERSQTEYDFHADLNHPSSVFPRQLFEFSRNPESWDNPVFKNFLNTRYREKSDAFLIAPNGYMPMGDNSPASKDARIWGDPPYVEEEFIIGKALFVYWPHSLNRPFPFFPNFWDMKFIK